MIGFSDVLCRYSLGTNPRGVMECWWWWNVDGRIAWIGLLGLLEHLGLYQLIVVFTHACIVASVDDMVVYLSDIS